MKAKELIKLLEQEGWRVVRIEGSHHIMKHDGKPGRLVIPLHGGDVKVGILHKILKQAGLK